MSPFALTPNERALALAVAYCQHPGADIGTIADCYQIGGMRVPGDTIMLVARIGTTPERLAALDRIGAAPDTEIAAALGVHVGTVELWRKRLGLRSYAANKRAIKAATPTPKPRGW